MHERIGFSAASLLLAPLSAVYGLAVRLRVNTYREAKRKSLPGFVLSIGNLSVGGTGKTPAACMLAEWALQEGFRVAVLSRGYRGRYRQKVLEVSDGHGINATPEEAGDEPFLLAKRLPGVPVIVSRKRYLAGLLAHEKHGTDFYILDDGFQHLALKRDLDLVLIDATNPFGNGHLLPWGPLREPLSFLKRADAFLLTRAQALHQEPSPPPDFPREGGGPWRRGATPPDKGDLSTWLEGNFPGRPVFHGDHVSEKIVFPFSEEAHESRFLEGKRVVAFAGIARPEAFHHTLRGLGAEVVMFKGFRDHHAFTPSEVRGLISEKERLGAECLITTEKDWVRIENLGTKHPDLAYLQIAFGLLSGSDRFYKMIRERLGPAGG
ncbi:MAG: tetraacyldisaccharide 4'-kinase [Pseudomonadota bacterium]